MSAESDASLASVGIIYQPQIRILSEAYEEYLDGLSRAKQFFSTLAFTERYASYVEVCALCSNSSFSFMVSSPIVS